MRYSVAHKEEFPLPGKNQHERVGLSEAIEKYRLGLSTVSGFIFSLLKIYRAPGIKWKIPFPRDFYTHFGIAKSSFYKALNRLENLGIGFCWQTVGGVEIWIEDVTPLDTPLDTPLAAPLDTPLDTPLAVPMLDTPLDTPLAVPMLDTPLDTPLAVPMLDTAATPFLSPLLRGEVVPTLDTEVTPKNRPKVRLDKLLEGLVTNSSSQRHITPDYSADIAPVPNPIRESAIAAIREKLRGRINQ